MVSGRFSRKTAKKIICILIDSLYIYIWLSFIKNWALALSFVDSICKIFVFIFFRDELWRLFLEISTYNFGLILLYLLLIGRIVRLFTNFKVYDILEEFHYFITLFQKTFSLTNLAKFAWLINTMFTVENLFFFITTLDLHKIFRVFYFT